MPCSPNPHCPNTDHYASAQFNTAAGSGAPFERLAHPGWVGSLALVFDSNSTINRTLLLRVTSADINAKQEITSPDVIDGRIDKTVYQLGAKEVEGTISLPVVLDDGSILTPEGGNCPAPTSATVGTGPRRLLEALWDWALVRDKYGRMCNEGLARIRYANHAAYIYDRMYANTLSMKVAQGDMVTFDIGVIGRGREPIPNPMDALTYPPSFNFLSPARVMTWNDVTITGIGGCGNPDRLFYSNQVREFNMEINNNIQRYYSLNGALYPVDINAGKREITGSMTLLGLNHTLRQLAETNQTRFTEKNEIRMAFYAANEATFRRDWTDNTSTAANSIFSRKLGSVIFSFEEIGMTNEVLETTVNYIALASDKDGFNFESMSPASSCGYPAW